MAGDDNASLAWTAHEEGAMALVEYRGLDQVSSPVGIKLLRQVYAHEVKLYLS